MYKKNDGFVAVPLLIAFIITIAGGAYFLKLNSIDPIKQLKNKLQPTATTNTVSEHESKVLEQKPKNNFVDFRKDSVSTSTSTSTSTQKILTKPKPATTQSNGFNLSVTADQFVEQTPELTKIAADFFNAQFKEEEAAREAKIKNITPSNPSVYSQWNPERQTKIGTVNYSTSIPFGQLDVPVSAPAGCTSKGLLYNSQTIAWEDEDGVAPFEIHLRPGLSGTNVYSFVILCEGDTYVMGVYTIKIPAPVASTIMLERSAITDICFTRENVKVTGEVNGKVVDLTPSAIAISADPAIAELHTGDGDIYIETHKKGLTTGTIKVGGKVTTFPIAVVCSIDK